METSAGALLTTLHVKGLSGSLCDACALANFTRPTFARRSRHAAGRWLHLCCLCRVLLHARQLRLQITQAVPRYTIATCIFV